VTSLFAIMGASPRAPASGLSGAAGLDELSYSIVGDSPIETRVAKLLRAVTLSIHDPVAVRRVLQVAGKCLPGNVLCKLTAGMWDLRRAVRYKLDEGELDRYAPYSESVRLGWGDCGSQTVAMMTHAIVGGGLDDCGPTTVLQRDAKTGESTWNHVYNWFRVRGMRYACDVSEKLVPFGWEVQRWRVLDRRDWLYDRSEWERWYAQGAPDDRLPDVSGRYRS